MDQHRAACQEYMSEERASVISAETEKSAEDALQHQVVKLRVLTDASSSAVEGADLANDIDNGSKDPQAAASISTTSKSIHTILIGICATVLCLGLNREAYARFQFTTAQKTGDGEDQVMEVQDFPSVRWAEILTKLVKLWAGIRVACAALFPIAVSFLQIDDVSSSVLGRTFALASMICSASGIVLTTMYISTQDKLEGKAVRKQWLQASQDTSTLSSLEFWCSIAAPVVCVVWSMIFCGLTALVLVWTKCGGGGSDNGGPVGYMEAVFIASAVFLTVLVVIALVQIYRSFKLTGGVTVES